MVFERGRNIGELENGEELVLLFRCLGYSSLYFSGDS